MRVCDMCNSSQIVYMDDEKNKHYCGRHTKEMGLKPNYEWLTGKKIN